MGLAISLAGDLVQLPPAIARMVVTSIPFSGSITPGVGTTGVDYLFNVSTLAADLTINAMIGTPVDGQIAEFTLFQNSSGGHAVTLDASFKVASGQSVTVSTTANSMTLIQCQYLRGSWRVTGCIPGY